MSYVPVTGRIQEVSGAPMQCCNQMVTVSSGNGIVNFIVSPDTFVADQTRLRRGMEITGFYDDMRPVPLIYPPQYQAVAVVPNRQNEQVMLAFFNNRLAAPKDALRLNLSPRTEILTANGQPFTCHPGNQLLLVYYSTTTRSIPPQTTPRKIIVFC